MGPKCIKTIGQTALCLSACLSEAFNSQSMSIGYENTQLHYFSFETTKSTSKKSFCHSSD